MFRTYFSTYHAAIAAGRGFRGGRRAQAILVASPRMVDGVPEYATATSVADGRFSMGGTRPGSIVSFRQSCKKMEKGSESALPEADNDSGVASF